MRVEKTPILGNVRSHYGWGDLDDLLLGILERCADSHDCVGEDFGVRGAW